VDLASGVLSHAIGQVLANCLDSTAPGLPNALTHLVANAQRKAEHDAAKVASGHGNASNHASGSARGTSGGHGPTATHGNAHGSGKAHGNSTAHGSGKAHGNSSTHASGSAHGRSSGHGDPHH
jgi:hypothetical protein